MAKTTRSGLPRARSFARTWPLMVATAAIGWSTVFAGLVYDLMVRPDPDFAPGPHAWQVVGFAALAAIPVGLVPGTMLGAVVVVALNAARTERDVGSRRQERRRDAVASIDRGAPP